MTQPESGVGELTGLILAGGESSRLGRDNKAMAELGGRPLMRHVLDRFEPQVGRVLVSVHETRPEPEWFGHEPVVDVVNRRRGPLVGLVSGLLRLECRGWGDWLLVCPCDGPFLPRDLGERLLSAALKRSSPVATARYEDVLQPVFSLWHLETLPVLKAAVQTRGRGGLMQVLDGLPFVPVDWEPGHPSPFFNLNTPEDWERARAMVDGRVDGD